MMEEVFCISIKVGRETLFSLEKKNDNNIIDILGIAPLTN
jgi:hypothetical protein